MEDNTLLKVEDVVMESVEAKKEGSVEMLTSEPILQATPPTIPEQNHLSADLPATTTPV